MPAHSGVEVSGTIDTPDADWMRQALRLAEQAARRGEVPVGAVLVRRGGSGDELIGRGGNAVIGAADPTAHAEINALRDAAARLGNYRLPDTTLYVTLEPCLMCAGALVHARVKRLVFGAREPRTGAVFSHARALESPAHNHRIDVSEGVLAQECAALMQRFFRERRRGRDGAAAHGRNPELTITVREQEV